MANASFQSDKKPFNDDDQKSSELIFGHDTASHRTHNTTAEGPVTVESVVPNIMKPLETRLVAGSDHRGSVQEWINTLDLPRDSMPSQDDTLGESDVELPSAVEGGEGTTYCEKPLISRNKHIHSDSTLAYASTGSTEMMVEGKPGTTCKLQSNVRRLLYLKQQASADRPLSTDSGISEQTGISIEDVLKERKCNAEELLANLGFDVNGLREDSASMVPDRFLPSVRKNGGGAVSRHLLKRNRGMIKVLRRAEQDEENSRGRGAKASKEEKHALSFSGAVQTLTVMNNLAVSARKTLAPENASTLSAFFRDDGTFSRTRVRDLTIPVKGIPLTVRSILDPTNAGYLAERGYYEEAKPLPNWRKPESKAEKPFQPFVEGKLEDSQPMVASGNEEVGRDINFNSVLVDPHLRHPRHILEEEDSSSSEDSDPLTPFARQALACNIPPRFVHSQSILGDPMSLMLVANKVEGGEVDIADTEEIEQLPAEIETLMPPVNIYRPKLNVGGKGESFQSNSSSGFEDMYGVDSEPQEPLVTSSCLDSSDLRTLEDTILDSRIREWRFSQESASSFSTICESQMQQASLPRLKRQSKIYCETHPLDDPDFFQDPSHQDQELETSSRDRFVSHLEIAIHDSLEGPPKYVVLSEGNTMKVDQEGNEGEEIRREDLPTDDMATKIEEELATMGSNPHHVLFLHLKRLCADDSEVTRYLNQGQWLRGGMPAKPTKQFLLEEIKLLQQVLNKFKLEFYALKSRADLLYKNIDDWPSDVMRAGVEQSGQIRSDIALEICKLEKHLADRMLATLSHTSPDVHCGKMLEELCSLDIIQRMVEVLKEQMHQSWIVKGSNQTENVGAGLSSPFAPGLISDHEHSEGTIMIIRQLEQLREEMKADRQRHRVELNSELYQLKNALVEEIRSSVQMDATSERLSNEVLK